MADAQLGYVEIPGYAEALRREDSLRRKAWTDTHRDICGVKVRQLTFRDVEQLTELRNGFFAPWRFETDQEFLGHCTQLVWWLSDCKKPTGNETFIGRAILAAQIQRLCRHVIQDPKRLAKEVADMIADTFEDAPKSGSNSAGAAPVAGGIAYIADTLAAGGYRFTMQEVLDMPLVQLFQLLRLVRRRLYDEKPTNTSDKIATDYLAKLNQKN